MLEHADSVRLKDPVDTHMGFWSSFIPTRNLWCMRDAFLPRPQPNHLTVGIPSCFGRVRYFDFAFFVLATLSLVHMIETPFNLDSALMIFVLVNHAAHPMTNLVSVRFMRAIRFRKIESVSK